MKPARPAVVAALRATTTVLALVGAAIAVAQSGWLGGRTEWLAPD
jgi:hypothetical protein